MPVYCWLAAVALLGISFPLYAQTALNSPLWYIIIASLLLLPVAGYSIVKWRQTRLLLARKQTVADALLQHATTATGIADNQLQLSEYNDEFALLLGSEIRQLELFADPAGSQPFNPIEQLSATQDCWQGQCWLKKHNNLQPVQLSVTALSASSEPLYLLTLQHPVSQAASDHTGALQEQPAVTTVLPLQAQLQLLVASRNEHYPSCGLLLISLRQKNGLSSSPVSQPEHQSKLQRQLQQLLPAGALLCLYNNDGFAVLLPPHLCREQSEILLNRLAHRIVLELTTPVAAFLPPLSADIGISLCPDDGLTAEQLLYAAEQALKTASHHHGSAIQFASQKMQFRNPEYQALETELYKALAQHEFDMYFQPRVSIGSNRIVGYEALLRWHSPKRGVLQPQSFLQMAEQSGLITSLDRLAFKRSCEQWHYWRQTGHERGRISLNISTQSLLQPEFHHYLERQLQQSELSADCFELELSEDALLNASPALHLQLQQLANQGFCLTLDNFGIGTSSLTMLQQHPLHSVKIAQPLVKDIEHNEQQRNITASLIRLASYLQLEVIASGIENEMQAYLLHVMGCDMLQGHLFSKALPASEIPGLLARENHLLRKAVS